jgi:uncharacterized protein YcbK (DUF882 family)
LGSAIMFKMKPYKAKGEKLSEHFTDTEFVCKDGSRLVMVHEKLPPLLEKIREHFKKPIVVNSGYRTPAYNYKVGGAKDSYHTKGMAADIMISGVTPAEVGRIARKLGAGGVGVYNTFTHVDMGPVRTWRG